MPDAKSFFYEGESTNKEKKKKNSFFSFVIGFKSKLLHDCSDQHVAEKTFDHYNIDFTAKSF